MPKCSSLRKQKLLPSLRTDQTEKLNIAHPKFQSYLNYVREVQQSKQVYKNQMKDLFNVKLKSIAQGPNQLPPLQQPPPRKQLRSLSKISLSSPFKKFIRKNIKTMSFVVSMSSLDNSFLEKTINLSLLINQIIEQNRLKSKRTTRFLKQIFSQAKNIKQILNSYLEEDGLINIQILHQKLRHISTSLTKDTNIITELNRAISRAEQLISEYMIKNLSIIHNSILMENEIIRNKFHSLPSNILDQQLSFKKGVRSNILERIELKERMLGDFSLINKNVRNEKRSIDQVIQTLHHKNE